MRLWRAASRQVREIFKRHTDLIEPLSLDEAYLDVSENKTGLPTATQVARTIRPLRTELDGIGTGRDDVSDDALRIAKRERFRERPRGWRR